MASVFHKHILYEFFFFFVKNIVTSDNNFLPFCFRWLKTGLQFVENLRTYTSSEKNKWTEAVELWSAFIEQSTLILPKVILTS